MPAFLSAHGDTGARDITVKKVGGGSFRSISQAAHALAGGDTPNGRARPGGSDAGRAKEGKRQVKKKRLSLSSSPAKPKRGEQGLIGPSAMIVT